MFSLPDFFYGHCPRFLQILNELNYFTSHIFFALKQQRSEDKFHNQLPLKLVLKTYELGLKLWQFIYFS